MNSKLAKKIRKMIEHIDDPRQIKFFNSARKTRYVWQQDNKIREEEIPTKSAIANIKRHCYQQMKKYADQPEVLNRFVKDLQRALEAQKQEAQKAKEEENE